MTAYCGAKLKKAKLTRRGNLQVLILQLGLNALISFLFLWHYLMTIV